MPVTDNGLGLRARTNEIIFGHDTPAGKAFDVALIWFIILSVVVVMLESVETVRLQYGALLRQVEWGFTIVFTIEYVLRLWCVERPMHYARSFFGIVDLLAILPTYLSGPSSQLGCCVFSACFGCSNLRITLRRPWC